jgi:soluble lytic murein transglycosylase
MLKALAIAVSLASLMVIYLPELPIVGRLFYPFYYRPTIEEQAKANGLDPLFVATVIRQESGFRPWARSKVGAIGLMQLMPKTARWAAEQSGLKGYQDAQLAEPATNIKLGCWYLKYLFSQFHNPAMVLAAYNGGEGNVAYWGSLKGEQLRHAFPETQSYVDAGMRAYGRYKALYPATSSRVTAPGLRVVR